MGINTRNTTSTDNITKIIMANILAQLNYTQGTSYTKVHQRSYGKDRVFCSTVFTQGTEHCGWEASCAFVELSENTLIMEEYD